MICPQTCVYNSEGVCASGGPCPEPACEYLVETLFPVEKRGVWPCGLPAIWRLTYQGEFGIATMLCCAGHRTAAAIELLPYRMVNLVRAEPLPTAAGQFAAVADAVRTALERAIVFREHAVNPLERLCDWAERLAQHLTPGDEDLWPIVLAGQRWMEANR